MKCYQCYAMLLHTDADTDVVKLYSAALKATSTPCRGKVRPNRKTSGLSKVTQARRFLKPQLY